MLLPRYLLEGVRKRSVPNIVQERRGQNDGAVFFVATIWTDSRDSLQESARDLHDPDGVGEPTVVRPREDQLTQAELFDPAKSLKLFRVDQLQQQAVAWLVLERDDIVNRVTYNFRPRGTHDPAPLRVSIACPNNWR